MTPQEFTDRWAPFLKEQPARYQADYDAAGYIVCVMDVVSSILYIPEE